MNTKLRNTTVAIVLAILSTLILTSYLNSLRAEISDGSEMIEVYVAKMPIVSGSGEGELLLKSDKTSVPKKFTAEDAVTSEADFKGKTLVVSLSKGEQLTKNKLRRESVSDISYLLSGNKVALSIPVDEVIGVAGNIKTGDKVMVIATMSPGPGGQDVTRVFLSDVEVLQSADTDVKKGKLSTSGGVKKTLTLAVTGAEAEKIVFAKEKGNIWVALQPANNAGSGAPTSGQTVETLFDR